jgi:3-oxoacyl-[acyl-carrier protein] reductase
MQMLVTGAARGIGAAVTALALREGHQVVAADRDGPALRDRWHSAPAVRCEEIDVRRAEAWSALVAALERDGAVPQVLINAAGVLRSGRVGDLAAAAVDLMLDVNVRGLIHGCNAVAAAMKRRGLGGHIVNIGSLASLYPTPGTTVYAASKFAVRGFSIAAAGDLAPHGIAVTLVGPGPVKTAMLEQQRGDADAALTFAASRALSADEVAAAILGPVLRRRPLEHFLPARDALLARISNAFPRLFLSQVARARNRGARNFSSPTHR